MDVHFGVLCAYKKKRKKGEGLVQENQDIQGPPLVGRRTSLQYLGPDC